MEIKVIKLEIQPDSDIVQEEFCCHSIHVFIKILVVNISKLFCEVIFKDLFISQSVFCFCFCFVLFCFLLKFYLSLIN